MRKVWIFALTALALGLILGVVLCRIGPHAFGRPSALGAGFIALNTDAAGNCVVTDFTEHIDTVRGFQVVWNIEKRCEAAAGVTLDFGTRNPLDPPSDPEEKLAEKQTFGFIIRRVRENADIGHYPYHIVVGGRRFSPEELEIYR